MVFVTQAFWKTVLTVHMTARTLHVVSEIFINLLIDI